MIVTFCLPQFKRENLRLQPWLTVHRVAMGFVAHGSQVHVVTDEGGIAKLDGISIHRVDSLRGPNSREITNLLQSIQPDSVVVSVTPLSLATAGWYRIFRQFSAYAFLSYPFYKAKQIVKAFPHVSWRERWEFGRHMLVLRHLWIERLVRLFNGVICQSRHTGRSIAIQTRSRIPVHTILPGINKEFWVAKRNPRNEGSETIFLYVGTASRIRGFFVVLDAFARVSDPGIRLKILARGADERAVKEIEAAVARRQIQDRVLIRGGWLEVGELRREIQSATAVLLPFVLVASELPVSVMESISCGTPVVVSDIDGLSDAAGKAGVVVPHGSACSLASAIQKIHQHKQYLADLNAACIKEREDMLSWDSVSALWQGVLTK